MVKSVFGKYELLKKIGQGGMAELFLARQTGFAGFEKLVVIKRILPALVGGDDSDEFVNMFVDEARLAARLNHPHIVQIYDLGFTDGQFYIAMEYVNGVDLRRLLNQCKSRHQDLPLPHAIKIASTVCEALHFAHDSRDSMGRPLGVVHRDISPHNVLVSFDGTVKLTDFGIAKATSGWAKTKGGALKGKLTYMAPEQVYERPVDRRTDVFSAALVLYEMVTGHRAYHAESELQLMDLVSAARIRPPLEVHPGLAPTLVAILQRALSREPEQRHPDALALQMELERFNIEQKEVSNSALIGKFVRGLFPEVLQAQEKTEAGGPALDGIVSGLELTHGTAQPTPSSDAVKTLSRPTPSSASGRKAAKKGTGSGVGRLVPKPIEDAFAPPSIHVPGADAAPTLGNVRASAESLVDSQRTDLLQQPPLLPNEHTTDVIVQSEPGAADDQRTELLDVLQAPDSDQRTVLDVKSPPLAAAPPPDSLLLQHSDVFTSPEVPGQMPTTPAIDKPRPRDLGPPLWVLAVGATVGAAILTMLLLLAWSRFFANPS